jgi:hypothetical protein
MADRAGRVPNWVVALAALALLATAGFAVVQLVDDGSRIAKSVSPAERGRQAAQRIRTVMATDDLGGQSGLTLAVRCNPGADSPGQPGLGLTYPDRDAVQARLREREWAERSPIAYRKKFGSWAATVVFTGPAHALLTVDSDTILGADCATFREGLRPLITASG